PGGIELPLLREGRGELLLGLGGGAADRGGARGRRGRASRARAVGKVRVADADRDLLERQRELLRRDDRDHGARSRPEVLEAVLDLGGAVTVDDDGRPGAGVAGVVPDGGAHADAPPDRRIRRLAPLVAGAPADLLGADPELLAADLGRVVLHA